MNLNNKANEIKQDLTVRRCDPNEVGRELSLKEKERRQARG